MWCGVFVCVCVHQVANEAELADLNLRVSMGADGKPKVSHLRPLDQ